MTRDELRHQLPVEDVRLDVPQASTDFSVMGDSSLAVALVRGRQEALAEIYERHSAAIHDVARRLCGPEIAQQVVQETFLHLWRSPGAYQPETDTLRSHLLMRAHLTAVDLLRTEAARAANPRTTNRWEIGGSEHLSTRSADHAWPLLASLPADERNAIWMTYFVGYTTGELAMRLHRPERDVWRQIIDGLGRLRANRRRDGV